MANRALVTGITGQDGSYLAELLLAKGYQVHGTVRLANSIPLAPGPSSSRIEHLRDRITLHSVDLLDQQSVTELVAKIQPTEIYNLAAQSFVGASWERPVQTADITGLGVTRMLEAIRAVDKSIRFYQASSSEIFGKVLESPQRETTPLQPRNPYGASKAYAHYMITSYRECYGIFACSGILFNHESPRRGLDFVTRKITDTIARIKLGLANELRLGNLAARRDWGFAGDYVQSMWLMLQQDSAEDFVIGSGSHHSVEEFVSVAFSRVNLDWRDYVVIDPKFYRPADVDILLADSSKAERQLGWKPRITFEQLVEMMTDADLQRVQKSLRTQRSVKDRDQLREAA